MKRLVILGAGGHGRVAADIAGKNGYDSIAFLDDTKKTCGRYPVMGESARFSEYDCDFFVAIGNPQVRRRMQEMLLTAGKQVTTLIHPSAVIGEDVTLGTGTLVAAGAASTPARSSAMGASSTPARPLTTTAFWKTLCTLPWAPMWRGQ